MAIKAKSAPLQKPLGIIGHKEREVVDEVQAAAKLTARTPSPPELAPKNTRTPVDAWSLPIQKELC
ncbi:MAG: hypothetical protein ACI97A_002049 [Planctomycetota bacterium]|jgi:hypothetical protein